MIYLVDTKHKYNRMMAYIKGWEVSAFDSETVGLRTRQLMRLEKYLQANIETLEQTVKRLKEAKRKTYKKATYTEGSYTLQSQKSNVSDYIDSKVLKVRIAKDLLGETKKDITSLVKDTAPYKEGLYHNSNMLCLVQVGTMDDQYLLRPWLIREDFKDWCYTRKRLVIHHAGFDLTQIRHHLEMEWDYENVWDSKIAETWITNGKIELKTGYKDCVKRYFDVEISKEERVSDWSAELNTSKINYAGLDVKYPVPLSYLQEEKIKELKLEEVLELEFETIPSVVEMQINGMDMDVDEIKRLHTVYTGRMLEAERGILYLVGSELNLNSPKQLLNFINNNYMLDLKSTASDYLKLFKDNEFIALLLEYRRYKKLISTYTTYFMEHCQGGKLFTFFNQSGAETGRFSSSGRGD